ncbi:ATP-binding protein [Desulfovibrio sp.]|uniref:ATP-binding protein n=1 Tax=Desulfovibrio sp. TaxID=885 RepID=UPI003D13B18E
MDVTKAERSEPSSGRLFFGLSPWLLIGVSLILGLAIVVLAIRNSGREKMHITQNLLDRADSLIWALEAGARTGINDTRQSVLQSLIVETAKQPGVIYLAVIDRSGKILAHSDPNKVGRSLAQTELPDFSPEDAVKPVLTSVASNLFEVYRGFSPLQDVSGRSHEHDGHASMHWDMQPEDASLMTPAKATSYAFVGIDRKPFTEALSVDYWNNILAASIVAAFGLAGVISLFWAHSYKRSRRKLKGSKAFAEAVVTSLPVGLITSDPDGKISMINETARTMLGIADQGIDDMAVADIQGLDWQAIASTLMGKRKVFEREMDFVSPDSEAVPISVSASEIRDEDGLFLGHLYILRDIAEVKRLQAEVQRNERLTALGNLAAGVAHEIRNPLSSIKGLASFLASKMAPGGAEEDAAKTMAFEVNRLNRVVSELLQFARPNAIALTSTDINDVITRALRLADSDINSRGITVRFKPDTEFPPVNINAERMTQALLNLFLNAVQAMEQGGILGVRMEKKDDSMFAIVVTDTGKGMDKKTLAAIFTPYFTTKGAGTGLGLPIVHQIVEGHAGKISVASTPGVGSVFTMLLPLHKGQEK